MVAQGGCPWEAKLSKRVNHPGVPSFGPIHVLFVPIVATEHIARICNKVWLFKVQKCLDGQVGEVVCFGTFTVVEVSQLHDFELAICIKVQVRGCGWLFLAFPPRRTRGELTLLGFRLSRCTQLKIACDS